MAIRRITGAFVLLTLLAGGLAACGAGTQPAPRDALDVSGICLLYTSPSPRD